VVSRVIEIDQDEALYRAMLDEPWFIGELEPKELQNKTIQNFLINIFDQAHEEAYRRNRSRWGIKYERELENALFHPGRNLLRLLKKYKRNLIRNTTS